ncbi:ribonuclease M5 [Bacillota bacterium]
MKPRIDKIVIVEGRDDENAVKAAVDAEVIVTSGFSISRSTWSLIEKAYRGPGILIFTDPDYAGESIRNRIAERFPESSHAYLSRDDARKDSDIGIENATAENIIGALEKAFVPLRQEAVFNVEDLLRFELIGSPMSGARREKIGKVLGIGSCNAKTFLARLNSFGISREEFYNNGQALFAGSGARDNR